MTSVDAFSDEHPPADVPPDETLFLVLAERARAVSSRHLVISLLAGTTAALGAVLDMSLLSALLAAAGGCQASFGVWGLSEQRLATLDGVAEHMHSGARRRWRVVRTVALGVGVVSGLLLANVFAFGFVGRWMS